MRATARLGARGQCVDDRERGRNLTLVHPIIEQPTSKKFRPRRAIYETMFFANAPDKRAVLRDRRSTRRSEPLSRGKREAVRHPGDIVGRTAPERVRRLCTKSLCISSGCAMIVLGRAAHDALSPAPPPARRPSQRYTRWNMNSRRVFAAADTRVAHADADRQLAAISRPARPVAAQECSMMSQTSVLMRSRMARCRASSLTSGGQFRLGRSAPARSGVGDVVVDVGDGVGDLDDLALERRRECPSPRRRCPPAPWSC